MSSAVREIFPGASETLAFDYVNALPLGAASVASAVISAHKWVGNKASDDVSGSFLVSTTGVVSGTQVRFKYQAAVAGVMYRVKTVTTFNDGQQSVDRMFLEAKTA